MTAQEVRDRLLALVDTYYRVGAHLGQPHYKRDLFELCREVRARRHHHPKRRLRLSADAVYDLLHESWIHGDPKKVKVAEQVREMWREWLYALDRC